MNKKIGVLVVVLALVVAAVVLRRAKPGYPSHDGIRIGSILSLTGDKAAYGLSAKRGIDLAVDEINAAGGLHGQKLAVINEDGKGSPRDSVSAFEKLTTVDSVPVVIGPLTSSEVLSVAPIAERKGVVLFTPTASSPQITTAGDYVFRNCPSDVFEASAMADVVRQSFNVTRVAIIYPNNDYGIGVLNLFEKRLSNLGGLVVSAQSFPDNTHDFRTQILNIKAQNPEAVCFVGYKELGLMVRQAKELGLSARFLSTALFEDPDVLQAAGDAAEGIVFTSIAFDPNTDNPRAQAFVRNYSEKYGLEPDSFAAISYDATHIVAVAIAKGGKTSAQIKDALYGIRDFPGLLGNTSFDSNGDVILPVKLKTVKNGKIIDYRNWR